MPGRAATRRASGSSRRLPARRAAISRKTKETAIVVTLDLDGTGRTRVATAMPFLDHMLTVMGKHGLLDLTVKASGDLDVDAHHTVEDLGIVLGQALKQALGDKAGITRFGAGAVPMDETLARATVDVSGRPYLVYRVPVTTRKIQSFDTELVEHFFEALVVHAGLTLHLEVPYGKNAHHMLEATFKAFGRALEQATRIDPRVAGVPSSKGRIE
ncbi:MAG TPA: imidazoleglycerol-phosphate dehydratase HisB [Nitrospiria bacterium]|nr:imidazoleglycerol-phosphate dehydratase HisB [Nitrospiria bacterium]